MLPTNIDATYRDGKFCPDAPLDLGDGARVSLTVAEAKPQPPEDEVLRGMRAAKTPEELFAAFAHAPPLPAGYNLYRAINESRRAVGAEPIYPAEMEDEE